MLLVVSVKKPVEDMELKDHRVSGVYYVTSG